MNTAPSRLTLWTMDSPVDPLSLATDEAGRLRGLCWGEDAVRRVMRREYPQATLEAGTAITAVMQPLNAYFSGDQAALAHVPWSLDDATAAMVFRRGSGANWRGYRRAGPLATARWPVAPERPAPPKPPAWR